MCVCVCVRMYAWKKIAFGNVILDYLCVCVCVIEVDEKEEEKTVKWQKLKRGRGVEG